MISFDSNFRTVFFAISKLMGLFFLSRFFTRKGVRILCYHNFGGSEEAKWHPKLFIKQNTFLKRMNYLKKHGYNVLPLESALEKLKKKDITDLSVIITIDDGWYGIKKYAHPILKEKGFPYTIYVTSYYSKHQVPVFNLIVAYLFYKTSKYKIDLSKLNIPKITEANISNDTEKTHLIKKIIAFGEQKDIAFRQYAVETISEILDVDIKEILKRKIFHIMQHDDLKSLSDQGIDLQLHSHRHRWPMDETSATEELRLNQTYLSSIQNYPGTHFCYPSGFFTKEQFSILQKLNIKSATTCEPGLNFSSSHYYSLKRFLDGENISQIEFEAELSGFLFILREIKNKIIHFRNRFSII